MSVYTTVSRDALAAWLAPLGIGELTDYAGIAAGMQNSNYYVTTTAGRWVLTLFEQLPADRLDFYLDLQAWLAERGLPCPRPLADATGRRWRPLAGKPAALLTCLAGKDVAAPSVAQCRTLGATLARLHLAGADFPAPPPNPCGAAWRQTVGAELLPLVSAEERALLADELAFQSGLDLGGLPRGVIHADLFRDNVLWEPHPPPGRPRPGLHARPAARAWSGAPQNPRYAPLEGGGEQISGLLDFYFAGEDCLLFDLAVVANDWCADAAALAALLAGYQAIRPLTALERAAWAGQRRAAALRFWLLRLQVRHHPRAGDLVTIKDPDHFRRLLQTLQLAPAVTHR